MTSKVTKIDRDKYFVYDSAKQKKMSTYSKYLIESGIEHDEVYQGIDPEADCRISVMNSRANGLAIFSFDVETEDAEALRRFIAALEETKFHALQKLAAITEREEYQDKRPGLDSRCYLPDRSESIEALCLTQRTTNILRNEGINTIEHLLGYSNIDLLKLDSCGKKSLKEIEARVAGYGGLRK